MPHNIDSSLNSCTIGDHVYIGANATIGKGAVVESGAMVAAGSFVPAGAKVPSGQVWAGHPAKFLRDLTAVERENLREQHQEYAKLAEIHSERTFLVNRDTEKPMRQYINDLDTYTTMKNAGLNEQLYYVAKVRSEDYGNDENFGYINEAQYSSKPFDYSQPHFEPYQHDYSKYPESNLE